MVAALELVGDVTGTVFGTVVSIELVKLVSPLLDIVSAADTAHTYIHIEKMRNTQKSNAQYATGGSA